MKARPNDPCPCGSGKKYKKCHGAPPPAVMLARPVQFPPEVSLALGKQSEARGDIKQAERHYAMALSQSPRHFAALFALGALAQRREDWEKAREHFERLVQAHPDSAEAAFALGNVYARFYDFDRARETYRRALAIDSRIPGIWTNLGNIEKYLGNPAEAVACYQKAVELDPGNSRMHSNLLLALHYDETISHDALYAAHCRWAQVHAARFYPNSRRWTNSPEPERALRIGYVSGHFDGSILSHFLRNVLGAHDQGRYRLYAYSATPLEDGATQQLRAHIDQWRDIRRLDDANVAKLILDDEIDILVDLDGHSPSNRLLVFAYRPAPIQVAWLDYFDTTGLDTMDYILTDPYVTLADTPQKFSEEPIRLPDTRLCYTPVSYAPPVREAPCLSRPHFTFGSFNRQDKLHSETIRVWAAILEQVPDSRLVLKSTGLKVPAIGRMLTENFARHGIDAQRLELRAPSPHAQYLEEYGDIDLALDTWPYNGGLTTCECLWMGVPVVAIRGERMIARQTASMLHQIGLEAFVATSVEDYVRIAVQWSQRREALAQMRRGLRTRMQHSPLCDSTRFTRHLEETYRAIWRMFCGEVVSVERQVE